MTYNSLAYLIYTAILAFIIIKVGWLCYTNGNAYVAYLFPDDVVFAKHVNNLLLTGYYLVNLGYTVYSISAWETISTLQQLIESISTKSALIVLVLALLHYVNIIVLQVMYQVQTTKQTH